MKRFFIVLMTNTLVAGLAISEKPKTNCECNSLMVKTAVDSLEGGEDMGSALPIATLPINDNGNTSDNVMITK